jgi:hypothetical protein
MTDNHMIEMVNEQFNRERIERLNQEAYQEILRIKSVFCPAPPLPPAILTFRSFPNRSYPVPKVVPDVPVTYCSPSGKTVFPSNGEFTFYTPLPSTTGKKVFHTNGRSTFFTPLPKNPFKKDREEQIEAINITFGWLITLTFLITICIHIISH